MKIVHIMLDEKFTDMAIRQFEEAYPGIHEYRVVAKALKYTTSDLVITCNLESLIPELERPDVVGVIFHSLPPDFYILLRHIPTDKCVVWFGWGYDYYSLLYKNESSLLLPKTRQLYSRPIRNSKIKIKKMLKILLSRLGFFKTIGTKSDLSRVDYFSPVLDIEYELVCRHVPSLTAKYITWNYGTAEDDLSLTVSNSSLGVNILAGNSATPTNNHIELFETICDQVDLTGRRVITPLSYGDPWYRDKIIKLGQKILGDAFLPLTYFMNKEQYLETIQSCGFVMMNHLRQQAVGNICMAMLRGAKIYLNPRSPVTTWFKSRGAFIGSVDNLDMNPLSEEQKKINQKLVLSHWSRESQRRKTLQLINAVLLKFEK